MRIDVGRKLGPVFCFLGLYYKAKSCSGQQSTSVSVLFLLFQGLLLFAKAAIPERRTKTLALLNGLDFLLKIWGLFFLLGSFDWNDRSDEALPFYTVQLYLLFFWLLPLFSLSVLAGLMSGAFLTVATVYFVASVITPIVILMCL